MKNSETFAYAKQDKFLISDNQIRKYLTFSMYFLPSFLSYLLKNQPTNSTKYQNMI